MSRPLLFCNIGWMRDYQGQTDADKIVGGGKYVKLKKRGEEVCNFVAARGVVYGYVQPVGDQIKLEKLGAPSAAESISGVDVVVTALRPGGGSVVVGWFREATVYRHLQGLRHPSALHKKNDVKWYRYEASASNVTLLHPDQRTLSVPRGKGSMGTSNVWYAENASPAFLESVRQLLGGKASASKTTGGRRIDPDPQRNAQVEEAAITVVSTHYTTKHGYTIKSREVENLGYDLDAARDGVVLRLEVKGLSGKVVNVQLTPNEYKAFSKRAPDYRLCIVTEALTDPRLSICAYNPANKAWMVEGSGKPSKIKIKRAVAAAISIQ